MLKKVDGWFEPHQLTDENIEQVVKVGPGVYILGNFDSKHKFHPKKISNSWQAKAALTRFIGQFQGFSYKPFKHQLPGNRTAQLALF